MTHPFDATTDPPMVAGQDYILVDEYSTRWNPDPVHVDEDDLWDPQATAWIPRPPGSCALLTGLAAGAIVGILLGLLIAGAVHAASRPAETTVRVDLSALSSARPTPAPTGEIGTAMVGGIIAYAQASLGDRYLALPGGPGAHVRICAGSGTVSRCLERTSTDAGPDLAKQRAGRIADVSFVDFAWLCRCDPPSVGLLEATIEWIAPSATPPATDVEP